MYSPGCDWRLEDLDLFAKSTASPKQTPQTRQNACSDNIGAYLSMYLEKAGFGSHGGRVIGFTRSAKPIYQGSSLAGTAQQHQRMSAKGKGEKHAKETHSQHFQGHSAGDHADAASAHTKAAGAASNGASASHHRAMASMHSSMASAKGGGARPAAMAA